MWDLPGPGIKPVSPAVTSRLFNTEPPENPTSRYFLNFFFDFTTDPLFFLVRRKLQANIFDQHRCRNSQQNIRKSNPTIHKKDHTPLPGWNHPTIRRMVQYTQINVIYEQKKR